jgi:hypothetical protein
MPSFKPVATPFLLIWTSSKEELEKLYQDENDEDIKSYLKCLITYRSTLTENNPLYKVKEPTPVITTLLQDLNDLLNVNEFREDILAALYNLIGLINRGLGKYDAAVVAFNCGAYFAPHSAVTFNSQLAAVMNDLSHREKEKGNTEKADAYLVCCLKYLNLAVGFLDAQNLKNADTQTKHIAAAIYIQRAYAYRKSNIANGVELADGFYKKACQLWPENNVIANQAGILFSKTSTVAALQRAEEIFEKFYPAAEAKNLFVTPYYRADVNIKLAAFFMHSDSSKCAAYAEAAESYLAAVENAINNNPEYDRDYKEKALSRMLNLKTSLAMVREDLAKAEELQKQVTKHRDKVPESKEAREKFDAKRQQVTTSIKDFTPYLLFRRPVLAEQQLKNEPSLSIRKNSRG